MKITYLITWLLLSITFMSCIRDEAPNAEADILTCIVPADILKRDPVIENNKVTLMVKADIDLTHQAPEFTLTPGATILYGYISGWKLEERIPGCLSDCRNQYGISFRRCRFGSENELCI